MELTALAQAILGFVAIVCVGAVLRLTGLVRREDAKSLNAVIIYVGLPAFVFRAVHGAAFTARALRLVALSWTVFVVLLVLSVVLSRLLRLPARRAGSFVLAAPLGNTGFIGYPLTSALLGPVALPFAVFYDVFGTVLQLVLIGYPVSRRYVNAERWSLLRLLKELATFPALLAALAALLSAGIAVPVPVNNWLDLLAKMVAPLIMLSVGISLRPSAMARGALALAVLAGVRLLFGPVFALVLGSAFALDPVLYRTAVLQAGMPSMMLTLAVGERFGLDDEFIAAAILVTTVASVVSIPLMQMLVK